MSTCHYATLRVSRDASQEEIRMQYKQLSLVWRSQTELMHQKLHPDKNNAEDATERFQVSGESFSPTLTTKGVVPGLQRAQWPWPTQKIWPRFSWRCVRWVSVTCLSSRQHSNHTEDDFYDNHYSYAPFHPDDLFEELFSHLFGMRYSASSFSHGGIYSRKERWPKSPNGLSVKFTLLNSSKQKQRDMYSFGCQKTKVTEGQSKEVVIGLGPSSGKER